MSLEKAFGRNVARDSLIFNRTLNLAAFGTWVRRNLFRGPRGLATHLGLMRSSARPPARPRVWLMLCAVLGPGATAQSVVSEVRLGGLFQHTAAKVGRFVAFVMAVHEINNSSALLPHTSLR